MPEKKLLNNWPAVEGRYQVGNKESPVAVCTNASIDDIEIDLEKIAIIGKVVTENIGIEKIIQNIVSNSNIRYLVLCGKPSKGHFVSQAIEQLIKQGIDKDKKIIGARGNMPYLKGIDEKLVERFREQITPINMLGETDSKKIEQVIDKILQKGAEEFSAQAIIVDKPEEIEAKASMKWIADPNGFFVISISQNPRGKIVVEHYQNNKLAKKITGSSAEEISKTIAELNLIGDFKQAEEHAMYLGRELSKAETALKNNLEYEQDKELIIGGEKVAREKHNNPANDYGWHD